MKVLSIILSALLFYSTTFSQDTINNFKVDNQQIIWQRVYDTKLNFKDLVTQIKTSGLFETISIDSLEITGDLRQFNADYKGAGYSEMITPIYVARSHINAFVLLDFKEGKYRVTLKKIVLTQAYKDALSKQGEKTNLELYAIKKEQFTNAFKKSPSVILNFTFNKLFELKNAGESNW
jgi:hypothetical protein